MCPWPFGLNCGLIYYEGSVIRIGLLLRPQCCAPNALPCAAHLHDSLISELTMLLRICEEEGE